MRALGLYDSAPPQWFIDEANAQAKASLTPEVLQKMWDEARKLATDATTKTGGSGARPWGN